MIQGEKSYRLIEITLSSGKKIEATAEHPFYIKGKGWNPAGSLKVGQVLVLHNGTTVVVEEVDSRVRQVRVFNFSVANAHNYFVGGDGVLVHNVRLSDSNNVPKRIREEYEKIKLGEGTPRIDRATGQQTIFQALGKKNRGSKEWDVPGTNHRILELPDGRLGYAINHNYDNTCLFPGPWYPEGGDPSWNKKGKKNKK